jgi:glycosyltransferase involved in cell wall biosynthesis
MSGREDPSALASWVSRLNLATVLIANSDVGLAALPALWKLPARPRTTVLLHSFGLDEEGNRIGHPANAPMRYGNLIDAYAVISQTLATQLTEEFYVSPERLHVCRLGVDRSFAEARRPRLVGNRSNVLWVGRLADEKNPLIVPEIAARWRERHGPSLRFVMVGAGPLAASLNERIASLRVADLVSLAGEAAELLPYYREADCLLLTSLSEGIPLVLFEAMTAGVPIITTTENSAIPEVLSDEQAYIVRDATRAEEYVQRLEEILAHPEEARKRAALNTARTPEFDKDRFARQMFDVLFPTTV